MIPETDNYARTTWRGRKHHFLELAIAEGEEDFSGLGKFVFVSNSVSESSSWRK